MVVLDTPGAVLVHCYPAGLLPRSSLLVKMVNSAVSSGVMLGLVTGKLARQSEISPNLLTLSTLPQNRASLGDDSM